MIALFARAWRLYRQNPILLVPNVLLEALGLVWFFAQRLLAAHQREPGWLLAGAAFELLWMVAYFVLGSFLTAVAYGMSAAAWQHDLVTYSDGVAPGVRRWWKVGQASLLAVALLVPLAFAAVLLVDAAVPGAAQRRAFLLHPPAGVVAGGTAAALVLWFFVIYVLPAIVISECNVLEAVAASAGLALGRARETVAMLVPLAVIGGLLFVAGWRIDAALAHQSGWLPAVYQLFDVVVEGLWATYLTLVVVGRFFEVGGTGERVAAGSVVPRYE